MFLLTISNSVSAITITERYRNSTNASVDPNNTSPVFRDINVPIADFPTGMAITDVNVEIRFDKRDEGAASDGVCRNHQGGDVFNNEIDFTISSPNGTSVDLVNSGSGYYSGNTRPGRIIVLFDDEGAIFTGTTPTAGTFQPEGSLSDFDQMTAIAGTWRLTLADSAGQDPLCFFRLRLTIEASNEAEISVTKTDVSAATTYTPGSSSVYEIVVSNAGPINVQNLVVNDTIPNGGTATWTCSGTGAASCAASGSGDISELVDIPANESVTFLVTVTWSADPTDY